MRHVEFIKGYLAFLTIRKIYNNKVIIIQAAFSYFEIKRAAFGYLEI
jgi:hypothetical protein